LPSLYAESFFWTSSPTYFAIRLGTLMMVLSIMFWLETVSSPWELKLRPLAKLGRNSLFIYWIHVEMVYGYASWPLRRNLNLTQAAAAYLIFCAMIYGAVLLKDKGMKARRARRQVNESQAVTA
jgi:fucose 4-O-acetylase-like acetyltransferase